MQPVSPRADSVPITSFLVLSKQLVLEKDRPTWLILQVDCEQFKGKYHDLLISTAQHSEIGSNQNIMLTCRHLIHRSSWKDIPLKYTLLYSPFQWLYNI